MNDQQPNWYASYLEFFTHNNGCWKTSNAKFQNENEKAEAYGNTWEYAIGKNGKRGRLFGWEQGVQTPDFWEFRLFWDGASGQVVTQQFGHNGIVGQGSLIQTDMGVYQQEQTFSLPDGRQWQDRHRIEMLDQAYRTTSFELMNQQWVEKRSYLWKPCQ
ncbi:MAG: hypothetical protein HKN88_03995 [Gammaproteobacteria bacterium]|nr:hypothetical protein [Gammaproteobacteria bacterium]NNC97215.1 hypothetical protein [Gammaproteobacteria bacterium]NNM15002.1 hypothetical protein [Gammaproteobacteria bacterium]